MPLSKRKRQELLAVCGQLNEDDTVDPRRYFRERYRAHNSRTQRLCSQVGQTIEQVLAELGDPVLQSLEVFSVQPAPGPTRLVVIVRPSVSDTDTLTPDAIVDRLHCVSGYLRREVAQAITRRKMPVLVFEVIWPAAESVLQ